MSASVTQGGHKKVPVQRLIFINLYSTRTHLLSAGNDTVPISMCRCCGMRSSKCTLVNIVLVVLIVILLSKVQKQL